MTEGDGTMENPEEAEQCHAHKAEVLNLEPTSKLSGRFVNVQVSSPTPRISDLVGLIGSRKSAFLSVSLVILMLLVWGPHIERHWHTA